MYAKHNTPVRTGNALPVRFFIMRFIIANIWVYEEVSDINTGRLRHSKQRIDLKMIRMIRDSYEDGEIIGTACYDKFNEFLFTVDLPFDTMNKILDQYQNKKNTIEINLN